MNATGAAGPSELLLRVASSVVLGAIAVLAAWVGGWFLALVWFGAAAMVAVEWATIVGLQPRRQLTWLMVLGVGLAQNIVLLGGTEYVVASILAGLLIVPALFVLAVLFGGASSGRDAVWTFAGVLYAAPIAVVPVLLGRAGGSGAWPLLWMFAVVWATDITAYFVGRAVGGPKLWPAVSPKKTWSGFVGGLAGGVLAGLAVAGAATTVPRIEAVDVLAMAVLSGLASLASQAGDLAESAMKRRFGVKDSGTLIPGHGGFLDRLDGFAAVAILICVLIPLAKVMLWTVAP